MRTPREPVDTGACIDDYCAAYRALVPDVRSFEQFKRLHLGVIAELPRISIPAIAKAVGLRKTQSLHHVVAHSPWPVVAVRQQRLTVTKQARHDRPFTRWIDETGDQKKGTTTDYVARQYLGNLGNIANGIVSVNADGVLDSVTFPRCCKVFKPEQRLHATDVEHTKPPVAGAIVQALHAAGFQFDMVRADWLDGERSPFIAHLLRRKRRNRWPSEAITACGSDPGERVRATRWRTCARVFSHREHEPRYSREIVFGTRHTIRSYQVTTDPQTLPTESTPLLMMNLPGTLRHRRGNDDGLRRWVEYGFTPATTE